ncbi:MAG TPA: RidA family protein, partial [Vampirovibrionales bacterium]
LPISAKGNLDYTQQIDQSNIDFGGKAALCAVKNALSAIKNHVSDLDKIKQIVKFTAFINCAAGFCQQPEVVNPASQLLIDIFGEAGKHARSAIGVSELPLGASIEIELIVELA